MTPLFVGAPTVMSYISVVLPKGQVTVPQEVRERMGLKPGDKLEFQLLRDGTAVFRAMNGTVDDLFCSIPYAGEPKTIADIDEGIATGAVAGEGPEHADEVEAA